MVNKKVGHFKNLYKHHKLKPNKLIVVSVATFI